MKLRKGLKMLSVIAVGIAILFFIFCVDFFCCITITILMGKEMVDIVYVYYTICAVIIIIFVVVFMRVRKKSIQKDETS